jgi:hypothetical protein
VKTTRPPTEAAFYRLKRAKYLVVQHIRCHAEDNCCGES